MNLLYSAFVWARRVLNSHFWCFLVRAVEALAKKVNPKAKAGAKGAGKSKGGSSTGKAAGSGCSQEAQKMAAPAAEREA